MKRRGLRIPGLSRLSAARGIADSPDADMAEAAESLTAVPAVMWRVGGKTV